MSNSYRKIVPLTIFLALVFAVTYRPLSAQEQKAQGYANLVWAQQFLWAICPELRNHNYEMTTTAHHPYDIPATGLGGFGIQVGQAAPGMIMGIVGSGHIVGSEPPKDFKPGPIYAKQLINTSFGFDKVGHLSTFASEGPAVGNQEGYEAVKQLVGFHPEWTDAQDISALLKAGALYGPEEKDKFLQVIPMSELEKLFGKITIASTEFETVTDTDQRFPLLHWVVMVNVKFDDGGTGTYRMYFEPFKGALIAMDAVSP